MSNPIWFITALLAGFGYAVLLYSKKHPWTVQQNYLIGFLRFFLVAILVFILVSPYFKQRVIVEEKPIVALVIDDSRSMQKSPSLASDLKAVINVANQLQSESNITFQTFLLSGLPLNQSISNISFEQKTTDLNQILNKIENVFDGSNLTDVILFTDGIQNTGISPLFKSRNYNVHTLATGDTAFRKDIAIKSVLFNKVTSSKVKFPVLVELKNVGFKGSTVQVTLKEQGKVLAKQSVTLSEQGVLDKTPFYWQEKEPGLHHYTIDVSVLEGEYSVKNNVTHIYIEVTDSKSKILIAGIAPHPDLKALYTALSQDNNFEVDLYIQGVNTFKEGNYDLAILHQYPSALATTDVVDALSRKNTSLWFILGAASDLRQLPAITSDFSIMALPGQFDKVTPAFAPNFARFNLDPTFAERCLKFPPVSVPFGAFNYGSWEPVLQQRVNTLVTEKPLFVIKLGSEKNMGILAGEGIWQWRLAEHAEYGQAFAFDEFIRKSAQLLAKKEAKTKFRCAPVQTNYTEEEFISFNIESYNDLFEPVSGNIVNLTLKNEQNQKFQYDIPNTPENNPFLIKGLQPGVYKYESATTITGGKFTTKGAFLIEPINLEYENTQADFNMLRELSSKNNGNFFVASASETLPKLLLQKSAQPIVAQTENLLELISIKWLAVVLILLVSLEWTLRKWFGSY